MYILQINEWEEEISNLKLELERKETVHREEMARKELKHNEEMKLAEAKYLDYEKRITKLEKQLESTDETVISQTDSEKLWERSQSHKNFGVASSDISMFQPHNPQMNSRGPQSLPSELVSEAHKEVRRLQELRRYIQEECDHLLLRKERLKEEVVWHADNKFYFNKQNFNSGRRSFSSIQSGGGGNDSDVWHDKSRNLDSEIVSMQNTTISL